MHQPLPYEKALLGRIANGDEAAFKALFEQYRTRLYNYCFRITRSREVAEEIVMDVFLKIWLGREMACEIEHFDSFLFRVAQNKAIDFLRRVHRDPTLRNLIWQEIPAAADDATDSKLICEEYENSIRDAIRQLSPQRQLVFQLSREQHLSHDQIASYLNLSKNTIKNHIVESLRFIKRHLGNHTEMIIIFLFSLLH